MSRPDLRLVSAADTAPGQVQMSRPKVFAGVVPLRRRAVPVISVRRDEALAWWADLLRRRCGSVERCAVMFDVTAQTARNWMGATARPHVDIVLQAAIWWPDEFAALADADHRRAA